MVVVTILWFSAHPQLVRGVGEDSVDSSWDHLKSVLIVAAINEEIC